MRLTKIKARRTNGNGIIHAVPWEGRRKLSFEEMLAHAGNTTLRFPRARAERRAERRPSGEPCVPRLQEGGDSGPH